jgi:hypothetical protein
MVDFTGLLNTLFIMAILVPAFVGSVVAMFKVEKVVTQRRQHRDTLQEIRRLKADDAYKSLHDMAEYLRAELKHGDHNAAELTGYEHCNKNLWEIMRDNGIHLDEEYR